MKQKMHRILSKCPTWPYGLAATLAVALLWNLSSDTAQVEGHPTSSIEPAHHVGKRKRIRNGSASPLVSGKHTERWNDHAKRIETERRRVKALLWRGRIERDNIFSNETDFRADLLRGGPELIKRLGEILDSSESLNLVSPSENFVLSENPILLERMDAIDALGTIMGQDQHQELAKLAADRGWRCIDNLEKKFQEGSEWSAVIAADIRDLVFHLSRRDSGRVRRFIEEGTWEERQKRMFSAALVDATFGRGAD